MVLMVLLVGAEKRREEKRRGKEKDLEGALCLSSALLRECKCQGRQRPPFLSGYLPCPLLCCICFVYFIIIN